MPDPAPGTARADTDGSGVADVLLWRLAQRVAAEHEPDPDQPTRCVSPLCAGQGYPCHAAVVATHATHAARQLPQSHPQRPSTDRRVVARGRAAVPQNPEHRHATTTALSPDTLAHRRPGATLPLR